MQCIVRLRISTLQTCPQCEILACAKDTLDRGHVVWRPNGSMRHLMHAGLFQTLHAILEESQIPDASMVVEARGLKAANKSRP